MFLHLIWRRSFVTPIWGMKWSDVTHLGLWVGGRGGGGDTLMGPHGKCPGCSQSGVCFDFEITPPLMILPPE